MRKGGAVGPLAAQNVDVLRNFYACITEFVSYTLVKDEILQIVHSHAHLNPLKTVFSEKPLILHSQEMWQRNVLNFCHVCPSDSDILHSALNYQ